MNLSRIRFIPFLLGIACFGTLNLQAHAGSFLFPGQGNDLIGEVHYEKPERGDNLHTIGRRYDIGYTQMLVANPKVNPTSLSVWDKVLIPANYILPPGERQGVVINLAEMRLYYYAPDSSQVFTYPVGVGQVGWDTPQGTLSIREKIKDPVWHVPASIYESLLKKGVVVPRAIAPGPQDPLGKFALRLSLPNYLLHGTNNPPSIGLRSSSGCIRLFPEDIENLFGMVVKGTPVSIINQPYKAGWNGGQLYLESHTPLVEDQQLGEDDLTPMIKVVLAAMEKVRIKIDWQKAFQVALKHNGIPEVISIGKALPATDENLVGTPLQSAQSSGAPITAPAMPRQTDIDYSGVTGTVILDQPKLLATH